MPALTAFTRKIAQLRDNVAGNAAIEFAFLLPIMAVLFVGGSIWTEAITIKRKVQLVSRAVGDLVAQDTTISDAEMTTIFNAADAVVQPFSTSDLTVIVSCINIDANGNAKVGWSDSKPVGSALAKGSTVTLPWTASVIKNTMNMASTVMVWSRAIYNYTPPVKFTLFSSTNFTGDIVLQDNTFFRQRTGSTIVRGSTTC